MKPEDYTNENHLSVVFVLEDIRSGNNVGSFFRTGDAFCISGVELCGITCHPPHRDSLKTALGASEHIPWRGHTDAAEAISVSPDDWPWWRGPNRNGIAPANQNPPLKWSEKENVIWKANVPGRGHGSPIVVVNQIFLATADLKKQTQSVMCIDRKTGKQLWKTDVHISGLKKKGFS